MFITPGSRGRPRLSSLWKASGSRIYYNGGIAGVGGLPGQNPVVGEENILHLLDVVNTAQGNNGPTNACVRILTYGATPGGSNNFHFVRMRGTPASPAATQTGDTIMSIGLRGNDGQAGTAGNTGSAAAIIGSAIENWTSTAHGIKVVFQTTPAGSTTRGAALAIQGSGGVSVGVDSDPGAGVLYALNGTKGTSTNDSAAAGIVGEVISANVTSGSAISLTSSTAANITSIALTAGEWDVSAYANFTPAATTSVTQYSVSISTTSATLDVTTPFAFNRISTAAQVPAGLDSQFNNGPVRLQLSGSQTVYVVVRAVFTVSTMQSFGGIRARRVR